MKKQILILTFFVAAILAGTNAFGQAKPYQTVPTAGPTCLTPTPFTDPTLCLTDALHPVQGETYDYTVNVTAATDVVRWFVVDNTAMELTTDSLISSLTGVLAAGNGAIDDGTGGDPYIFAVIGGTYESGGAAATGATSLLQLQWKFFDGISNEILLVAYVETAPDCTDNIAVMRIIPKPAFTIDIASVLEDGSNPQFPTALGGTPNEECVSPIEMAWYNGSATTPDQLLTVDYGENWVYFVVNGANYFDSWQPRFQIDYTGGTDPAAQASWAYLADATATTNWNTLTGSLNGGDWTSPVPVIAGANAASIAATTSAVGNGVLPIVGGECIVVRVRLDWGTDIEHDQANGVLTLRADGTAYDGDGANFFDNSTALGGAGAGDFDDKHYVDCADDDFTNDFVDYLVTPRPLVEEGAPVQEIKTGVGVN